MDIKTSPLNCTFYHRFSTGNILKIEIQRDGINAPVVMPGPELKDINWFETQEFRLVLNFIGSYMYDIYTDSEVDSLYDKYDELCEKNASNRVVFKD